jgi:hypothetical protein
MWGPILNMTTIKMISIIIITPGYSNNSAGSTDQSQVAQPELLLAILLPVAQQIIPSLTCTTITT